MKTRVTPTPSTHRQGRNGVDVGLSALSTLVGGFLVWGGIGWLLDHWWGTRLMTPLGVLFGMVLGIYALVARVNSTATGSGPVSTHPGRTTESNDGPPEASDRRETS